MKVGAVFGVGDQWLALAIMVGFFVAMVLCLEVGRTLGRQARGKGGAVGVGTIDAALFALLGLLIAFTFSGAATRFEGRRDLIRDEANAVGTAWLRVDLVTPAAQPVLRQDFRRYRKHLAGLDDARAAGDDSAIAGNQRDVRYGDNADRCRAGASASCGVWHARSPCARLFAHRRIWHGGEQPAARMAACAGVRGVDLVDAIRHPRSRISAHRADHHQPSRPDIARRAGVDGAGCALRRGAKLLRQCRFMPENRICS